MEKPNAYDLIQQVKDYFKAEYGLNVFVKIHAYTHVDKHITAESAWENIQQISQELGGMPEADQSKNYLWVQCRDLSNGNDVTIFHPEESQTS